MQRRAELPVSTEHALLAEDLLRLSDVAMYVAKESHSGVVTYSSHRDRNSTDRLTLLSELRQALDSPNGGIEVLEVRCRRDNRRALDEAFRALAHTGHHVES